MVEIPPSTTATSMLPTPTIIPTDTAESDDLSSGEIAGIVIGSVFAGIILLAIIVIIVVWYVNAASIHKYACLWTT